MSRLAYEQVQSRRRCNALVRCGLDSTMIGAKLASSSSRVAVECGIHIDRYVFDKVCTQETQDVRPLV